MKYQSELIKEIIDTRGHEKSSLHYESECIESWIEENKGAYPKLTDYQAEWLNYINENPIGEFPYESITDVTNATIDNVVPLAYKSAILKGNTKEITGKNIYTGIDEDGYISLSSGFQTATGPKTTEWLPCEPNTTYVCNSPSRNRWLLKSSTGVETAVGGITGNETPTVTTLSDTAYLRCYYKHDGHNGEINLQIEKGDISTDYEPYWKKLESVKMPVLTTINGSAKILTDTHLTKTGELSPHRNSNKAIEDYILIPPMDVIVSNVSWLYICFYDENKNFISDTGDNNINKFELNDTTIPDNAKYFRFHYNSVNLPLIRFINGTDYIKATIGGESFKTNILTVNEDVTLRGIGDVKDTLDCLTGKLTERISEVELNGSENWEIEGGKTNTMVFKIVISDMAGIQNHVICDCLPTNASGDVEKIANGTRGSNGTTVFIALLKSKATTVSELKSYLNINPIKIKYILKDESVKTVDLTITNQDGETLNKLKPIEGTMHIATDGNPIKPTFSGEIPVEAITQNLASFVGEE